MLRFKILKKFLIPGTVLTAALAVQSDGDDHTGIICDPKNGLVKPSELPIYGGDECKSMDTSCQEPSPLEGTIGTVRKELWVWYDRYKGYRQKVIEVVQTGKAHTEATLDYLKEENNYLPRVGAISLGGIAGLVFGLRGGWTRRLTYASTGSITMAALCYPRHATDVSKEAISYVKKGFVITYNFIYGVKPEGLKLPLPPKLRDIKDEPKAATPQVEVDLQTVPDKLQSPDVIDSVVIPEESHQERDTSISSPLPPPCFCPDPFVTGHTSLPLPCEGKDTDTAVLDDLAENASDIFYWGFRFIHH